jgi:Kef-type K+ transport system membrane component KefB/Trk K+ transport system NAD-binding subunit
MTKHETFQSLLVLTLLALAVPLLIRQLSRFVRLPIIVGEIIAGIIVGRSGFNLIHETTTLKFLSDFGFIFLMFLSGLELNFAALRPPADGQGSPAFWRRPAWLAAFAFLLTLLLAMGAGFVFWKADMTRNPLLMGLILSTTSLGIVMPVLKERELMSQPYGQCLLLTTLVSDFMPLLLLGLLISILTTGFTLNLLLFLVLLLVFVGAAQVSRWVNRHEWTRRVIEELSHATAQIRVRGAFALIVVWVVLAGSLGTQSILGAFLAGAIIAQTRRGPQTAFEEKLDAMGYGFFIPIFFITIGARFDLPALTASPNALLLTPLLIALCYVVKVLPALCFRLLFSWRESIAAGFLLASRLSLIVAASAIALDMKLITEATNSAIILVAIVTCTASPVVFNRLLPRRKGEKRGGTIILGTDFLAEMLGKRLLQDGESVTFIGRDAARLEKLREAGFNVVIGSPEQESILAQAGAEHARAMVTLSNDPELIVRVSRCGRERFQIPAIVARAELPEQVKMLQSLGVQVVQPALAMALALEGALHFPTALSVLTDRSDEFDLVDAPLGNPELIDAPLRQVHLRGQAVVLGVRRRGEDEVVVPHGDTVLRAGDVLMLCGNPKMLEEARRWISGS